MKPSKALRWTAVAVAFGTITVLIFPITVSRDFAFICQSTGSRKGYVQWFGRVNANEWYIKSALEAFIEEKYPTELKHRWISSRGTGRNIFGIKVLYGHGRPKMKLQPEVIAEYMAKVSDPDKKRLYDTFCKGGDQAITAKVAEVWRVVFDETANSR